MTTCSTGVMSGELASTIRPHSPPHGNRAEEKSAQRHAYLFVPSRQLIPALLTQRHIFGQITLHTAKITTTSIGMQKKAHVVRGLFIYVNSRSLLFPPHVHFIVSDFFPNSTEPKRRFLSPSLVPSTLALPLSRNHTCNK